MLPRLIPILLLFWFTQLSYAQDRYTEVRQNAWSLVQYGVENPNKAYTNATPNQKLAREYAFYAGLLVDSFRADTAHAPRRLLDEAKRYLYAAYELYPDYRSIPVSIGNVLVHESNDYHAAIQWYYKALAIDSGFFDAKFNLGISYMMLQQYDSALLFYNTVLNDTFTNIKDVNGAIASCYGLMDSLDKELEYLQKALAFATSENAPYLNYKLGIYYGKKLGNLQNAILYLSKALFLQEVNLYYEDLSVAYGLNEQYKEAYNVLQKAIKKYPDYLPFYVNLAITCRNMGKKKESQKYWDKAYSLGYKDPDDKGSD